MIISVNLSFLTATEATIVSADYREFYADRTGVRRTVG